MNGEQLRLSTTARARHGRTRGVRDTTTIGIPKGIECRALQTADRRRCSTKARAPSTRSLIGVGIIESANELPSGLGISREDEGLTVVAGGNDGLFARPGESDQGKGGHTDSINGRSAGINDVDGAVVTYEFPSEFLLERRVVQRLTREGKHISGRGESDGVDPPAGRTAVFTTDGVEWQLLSPNGRCRACQTGQLSKRVLWQAEEHIPLINVLDIGREDSRLHVCTPGGEKHIVRVPVNGQDGGPDRLL